MWRARVPGGLHTEPGDAPSEREHAGADDGAHDVCVGGHPLPSPMHMAVRIVAACVSTQDWC